MLKCPFCESPAETKSDPQWLKPLSKSTPLVEMRPKHEMKANFKQQAEELK